MTQSIYQTQLHKLIRIVLSMLVFKQYLNLKKKKKSKLVLIFRMTTEKFTKLLFILPSTHVLRLERTYWLLTDVIIRF